MDSTMSTSNPEEILSQLSEKYGTVFVQFACCCIVAARDGMTMQELEDVCSLNEAVLNEQYERDSAIPAIRRIPQQSWTSFSRDLSAYFRANPAFPDVKTFASEAMTLHIRHEYLSDLACFVDVHTILGQYFSGTWSGDTPKPFENTERLQELFSLPKASEAVRHVAAQPLVFPQESSRPSATVEGTRYNIRKLREQTHHLIAACQWDDLLANCLGNYEYLRAKISTTSLDEVLDDFEALPERILQPLASILGVMKEAKQTLSEDAFQLASQLAGRLLPPASELAIVRGYLSIMLEGVRQRGTLRDAALLPANACIPSQHGHTLEKLQSHGFAVHGIGCMASSDVFVTVSDDKYVKVWHVGSPSASHSLQILADWGRCAAISPAGDFAVAGGYDEQIVGFDVVTGEVQFQLKGHLSYVNSLAVFPEGKLIVSGSEDGFAIVWDRVRNTELTRLKGHDGPVTCVAVCDDRRVLTASNDGTLRVWDVDTGDTLNVIYGHTGAVFAAASTHRSTHVLSGGADCTVRVYAFPGRSAGDIRNADAVFSGHENTVTAVRHTHSGSGLVISSSKDKSVRMWNFVKKTPVCVFKTDTAVLALGVLPAQNLVLFGTESGIVGRLELNRTIESLRNRKTYLPSETEEQQAQNQSAPKAQSSTVIQTLKQLRKSVSMSSDNEFGFGDERNQSATNLSDVAMRNGVLRAKDADPIRVRPRSIEADIALSQVERMNKDEQDFKKGSFADVNSATKLQLERQSSFEQQVLMGSNLDISAALRSSTPKLDKLESLSGSRDSILSNKSQLLRSPLAKSTDALDQPPQVDIKPSPQLAPLLRKETFKSPAKMLRDVKTLKRSKEALADKKFDAIEASNLSVEDKQAAFEALVLGENPDIVNIEIEQRHRRPVSEENVPVKKKNEGCCVLL
eukprot:m.126092 g.126092  ORF g.126092 m.126092 type:complete len:913 (+) comp15634_c0_seq1:948-3686(+)